MTAIELLRPELWPVLLVAPAGWCVLRVLHRARGRAARRLVGPHLQSLSATRSAARRRTRLALFTSGVLLALASVLGPTWGKPQADARDGGIDVLVCLDVSRSMLARDQAPSRLVAAQRAIRELAERAEGDRLGLVLFAGDAVLTSPLTTDVLGCAQMAEQAGPLSVPRGGSDLGAALELALDALRGATGDHEAVLLLTDGEDTLGRGLAAAERCAANGITVHCVGFGSRLGSRIAVNDGTGETYVKDAAGDVVVSAMDVDSLTRLAEATGGAFVQAADHERALTLLYEDRLLPMARKARGEEERKRRENRYQWPLAAAFGLLILDLCLSERRPV